MSAPHEMSILKLVCEFEHIIECAVAKAHKFAKHGNWNEDFITRKIVEGLIESTPSPFHVTNFYLLHTACCLPSFILRKGTIIKWTAAKQVGKPEQQTGDLALIARFKTRQQTYYAIQYFECKKRDLSGKKEFRSMRREQAEKILEFAPRAFFAFYDYGRIAKFNPSYAFVVPMDSAVSAWTKSPEPLRRWGSPFSAQLVRCLLGRDIHFPVDQEDISELLNELTPKYILLASVGIAGCEPELDPLLEIADGYGALDS